MSLLNSIVSLLASMRPIWSYSLNYVFALAFLATVPVLLDTFWRR